MESTRPIRALARGLDALTVLNLRDGATVSEIAQEIRLPRTTVYRILETLCNAGFVFRDPTDDRYRLTIRVRDLSRGFDDESWIGEYVKPCLQQLGRELVWPVSFATLCGERLMIRETTDHLTPLALERYSAGFRWDLPGTAAGRIYLASCPADERARLLARLHLTAAPLADLERVLTEARSRGYATSTRSRRQGDELCVSIPVMAQDRLLAALTLRLTAASVPLSAAVERFLPKLRQCAAKIGSLVFEQQAVARAERAPEAAA